jgi:hypothetical protein
MTFLRIVRKLLMSSAVLAPAVAFAQAAAPTPPPAASAEGSSGAMTMIAVVVGLLLLVGAGVKLYDLKRKRDAEAVHLQAQISDALLREQSLFGLPITPTAHVPLWSGTPATVQVTGHVPSEEAREAAMRIVRDEATRIRPDVRVEERLSLDTAAATRAA